MLPVPTENLIRTVRVTDRADVGPANDGNVRIAAVHSVNVDEWLASFGRSSGRRAACTVFRRRSSMAVVRPRDRAFPAHALLHESSRARTRPTDRILTGRFDMTLVGRGRSSDSGSHSRGRSHSPAWLDSGREGHRR